MTQEDFAARLMISRNYVSLLEGGKKTASKPLERRMLELASSAKSPVSTVNESSAHYFPRNKAAAVGNDRDSSVKLNPAFAPPAPNPTEQDCLNHLAAYLAEARHVPGLVAHTLIELKKQFKIQEARAQRED
jgi:transcriptional regulator with XRE-family HTH domain